MSSSKARSPRLLSLLLALGLLSSACRSAREGAAEPGLAPPVASSELAPLTLTDSTPNLLLTWVDAEGDFHVVEKTSDVPADRRAQVRVVVTDRALGTGQMVYVADLTAPRPDGTYDVKTLPRTEWEKIGADRRKTRLEALAPGARPSEAAGAPDTAAPGAGSSSEPAVQDDAPQAAIGNVSAIVYGADWCKPCHDAQRYLEKLGVKVTKKDVEESRSAQAEMQQKLARVNRRGAGIPVIDVMGKILVGFSPGSLKQAVDAARRAASQRPG